MQMCSAFLRKQSILIQALRPDANGVVLAIVLQGVRVWLRHKEQLLPSTVSSCDDSSLVLTTDYGKVRTLPFHLKHFRTSISVLYLYLVGFICTMFPSPP